MSAYDGILFTMNEPHIFRWELMHPSNRMSGLFYFIQPSKYRNMHAVHPITVTPAYALVPNSAGPTADTLLTTYLWVSARKRNSNALALTYRYLDMFPSVFLLSVMISDIFSMIRRYEWNSWRSLAKGSRMCVYWQGLAKPTLKLGLVWVNTPIIGYDNTFKP